MGEDKAGNTGVIAENRGNPGNSANPGNPENPGKPGNPENPGKPGNTDNPGNSANPANTGVTGRKLYLASGSPRRSMLLRQAGFEFTVIKSGFDESKVEEQDPFRAVELLSRGKAESAAEGIGNEEGLILAADTVVVLDGRILGKPVDEDDALDMLKSLQGREHQVVTGVTAAWREEGTASGQPGRLMCRSFHEVTRVEFYPVSERWLKDYIDSGEWTDKAGSYGIQGVFGRHVRRIEGDYSNVVGLPLGRVFVELEALGITP